METEITISARICRNSYKGWHCPPNTQWEISSLFTGMHIIKLPRTVRDSPTPLAKQPRIFQHLLPSVSFWIILNKDTRDTACPCRTLVTWHRGQSSIPSESSHGKKLLLLSKSIPFACPYLHGSRGKDVKPNWREIQLLCPKFSVSRKQIQQEM